MKANRLALASAVVLAAGLAPAAQAQGRMPTYEPQHRLRTSIDNCLKNEVLHEAHCVRKCGEGFRMDLSEKKARCVGLRPDARYTPAEPNYTPPPKAKPVPGA